MWIHKTFDNVAYFCRKILNKKSKMKLRNNTIFITGGSSGIGLELSRVLTKTGNKLIICGRSVKKLNEAKKMLPDLTVYQCDLSSAEECKEIAKTLAKNHPDLNVLINNAAMVNKIDFFKEPNALELAEYEYQTNLMAPIRLIKMLQNTLLANKNPTIVNITTGLIYAPRLIYPFYNSSKAALHSFTQTLRPRFKKENIEVFEVMFPAVDTPWHKGKPPKIAISTEAAVADMIKGLEKGKPEIRIKGAKLLYRISRLAPSFAFKKVNEIE
jgi:uncharacterized oxidoreductase